MPEHVREFLIALGVADQKHSGRTFIEHLEGTYQLLKEHGETIALAGALHSIYGTQFYKPRNIPAREQVKALVGDEAEWLAYLFCTLPRGRYSGVDPDTAHALNLIREANTREQLAFKGK